LSAGLDGRLGGGDAREEPLQTMAAKEIEIRRFGAPSSQQIDRKDFFQFIAQAHRN
jgi:hypothetical protein